MADSDAGASTRYSSLDDLEVSTHLSTASTQMIDNRVHGLKLQHAVGYSNAVNAAKTALSSPSNNALSKNSIAASRLIRNRKDRGSRGKAAQQLMEHLGPPSLPEPTDEKLSPPQDADKVSVPTSSSPSSKLRNRIKNRHRGSGGAFAKLMVQGPVDRSKTVRVITEELKEELSESAELITSDQSDCVDETKVKVTVNELDGQRKLAVAEFSKGPESNLRYHQKLVDSLEDDDEDPNDFMSEASIPSILNRSEIFHQSAAAAVVALLTPRYRGDQHSVNSSSSNLDEVGLRVSPSKRGVMVTAENANVSAFRGPHSPGINSTASAFSQFSTSALNISYEGAVPKSSITEPILSTRVEDTLEVMKAKMIDPSKTLSDLLGSIVTPEGGEPMDRGFMVRRKNACGALKVLTSKPENRRTLCWTIGVLPALTSVLDDTGDEGLSECFPDPRTRSEYIEARKRAVSSLVNLAVPKENRIPIFHSPGLIQAVTGVIVDDSFESRQGCCALVAYLCKTQDNRLLMAQVPGMLSALTSVIAPIKADEQPKPFPPRKRVYHWDSETEDSSTRAGDSFSTDAKNESTMTDGSDRYTSDRYMSSRTDDDSAISPQGCPSPHQENVALGYDDDPNQCLHTARKNVFAALQHLVKEKDNAYALARHEGLIEALVDISKLHNSPSHAHAVKIIANITRHRDNAKHIVFKIKIIVPAMVFATKSPNEECRQHALYALQNVSQDQFCRQEIANTKDLILSLCQRVRQGTTDAEKLSAMSALKNLTDEPANLIPMSNTAECFATLMQIAHGNGVDVNLQYLACDALATISHWLRKIATSGSIDINHSKESRAKLFEPSLKVVTFEQWT